MAVKLRLTILGSLLFVAALVVTGMLAYNAALASRALVQVPPPPAQDADSARVLSATGGNGSALWYRENFYITQSTEKRIGSGTEMREQVTTPAPTNPERVKVLVVGDSATWGHGLEDLDARWPVRLEAALNARTAPGAFEVQVISQSGASTAKQAEWLTPERVAEMNPDIIVVAHNFNDVAPDGNEVAICGSTECPPVILEYSPAYRECTSGGSGLGDVLRQAAGVLPELGKTLSDTKCDLEVLKRKVGLPTFSDVIDDPEGSGFYSYFTDAVASIKRAAGDRPIVHMRTASNTYEWQVVEKVAGEFEKAGFVMAPMKRARQAIFVTHLPNLMALQVNPGNGHPGPVLTQAFAEDVADATLGALPADRVARAESAASAPTARPLVSNYLPVGMTVSDNSPTRAVVVNPVQQEADGFTVQVAGAPLPPQYAPCAALGRPYARVMLDPTLPEGATVTLTLKDAAGAVLDVASVGYAEDDDYVTTGLGDLTAGQSVQFTAGRQARGVLLVSKEGTCDLNSEIVMTPFIAEFTVSR